MLGLGRADCPPHCRPSPVRWLWLDGRLRAKAAVNKPSDRDQRQEWGGELEGGPRMGRLKGTGN